MPYARIVQLGRGGGRSSRRGSAIAASLSISDGWKPNDPNRTHELASLIVAPTPGTNGSIIAPAARIAPMITSERQRWYGIAIAMPMPTSPKPGPHQLAREDRVRRFSPADLVGRRRRQHHHQTEHDEHGDDHDDRVVHDGRRTELLERLRGTRRCTARRDGLVRDTEPRAHRPARPARPVLRPDAAGRR